VSNALLRFDVDIVGSDYIQLENPGRSRKIATVLLGFFVGSWSDIWYSNPPLSGVEDKTASDLVSRSQLLTPEYRLLLITSFSTPKSSSLSDSDRPPLRSKIRGLIFRHSDRDIIAECGLDAYLFIRYLKTLLRIFLPLAVVLLSVLIPVNVLDGRGKSGGVNGMDQLSWTNVSPKHTKRYWAHLLLALVVVLWTCYIFQNELQVYTRLRQERFTSYRQSGRASGTTVLVTDIPKKLLTISALEALYNAYPGGVQSVFINRDFTALARKIQRRDRLARMLEAAETRLIQNALLSHSKRWQAVPERFRIQLMNGGTDSNAGPTTIPEGVEGKAHHGPLWRRYLTAADRETLRLPVSGPGSLAFLPFVGDKVDKIDHCRQELHVLNCDIQKDQRSPETYEPLNSAFIRFNWPVGAHVARQSVHHPGPYVMMSSQVEESLQDIIWRNVSMTWWERYLRISVAVTLCTALIILCTIPVAFTGLLSQLSYLAVLVPWLSWLLKLPGWLVAIIQGVLPQCLLATVMGILPLLLQCIVKEQAIHTHIAAELFMQDYYFVFLFVQIFLVISISSGLTAILSGATQDFKSVAVLITQNLPKASNYFFSYMLLQALSMSAAALLQVDRLILLFLIAPFVDNTAREKWNREREPEMRWGMFFPIYTNLAVIGKSLLFSLHR